MARARTGRTAKRGGTGRGAALIGRAMSLLAFLPVASRAPLYARLILALALDPRTPPQRKAILIGALGYVLIGRDLIPDDVPLIGGIDDLVVVVVGVDLFLDGVPADLLGEKLDELGVDRAAFERDIAQIRRLTPGPVRRTIRRIPQIIDATSVALRRTGLGPRMRAWISREESIA